MTGNGFEPRIIAFLCNWCTYAAADAAGISRMQQPLNVDVIRVMCSGRIDPSFVLKAFLEGADGVIVSGCHPPGDCHYGGGNYKTFRRMPLLERLLQEFFCKKSSVHNFFIICNETKRSHLHPLLYWRLNTLPYKLTAHLRLFTRVKL